MTIDCVAYLMTYELHVLEVYVYGASNAVYCMDSTLQRLRAVCAATARLLFLHSRANFQHFLNACPLSWRWSAQGSCLEGQLEDFYFSGINSLPEKCCKYIELAVDIILKNKM